MPISRRPPPVLAKISEQGWLQVRRNVERCLEWALQNYSGLPAPHQRTHLAGGSDALQTPGLPDAIVLANAAGTPQRGVGPSYAYEDHDHGDVKRDVRVQKADADVGTRNALNFEDTASVVFTVTDEPGGDKVTITAAASGSGSGGSGSSSPGMQGIEGEQGEPGIPGQPGTAGATGATGSGGPPGPPGEDGEDGFPGLPGATGATGATGTAGVDGRPGVDGVDGSDGAEGPPGQQGATGTAGATGTDGRPGVDGVDGSDGAEGPPGFQGTTGAGGPAGADGRPGFDGSEGSDGGEGPPGAAGAAGTPGTAGALGPPGFEGAEGDPGYAGPPGSSGTQGDKGGLRYAFSTDTTGSDPGQGVFKYESATIASVTRIYIDNLEFSGTDVSTFITAWDDSSSTVKGYLVIKSNSNSGAVVNVWSVSAVSDLSGFWLVTVAYIAGALPASGEACTIEFSRTGDVGTAGTNGATGPSGLIGPSGPAGEDGDQGPQGIQGATGAAGGGGGSWTEGEVDFGTQPVYDTTFTITDAAITSAASKVQILESGKTATGRGADGDSAWDSIGFAALPAVGSAQVWAKASPGPVVGKRKYQYAVA